MLAAMNTTISNPDDKTARKIFSSHISEPIFEITRFPTGLCHFVYDITTITSSKYALRISSANTCHFIASAMYWNEYLKNLQIPIPSIYAHSLSKPNSYMLIERFQGTDLCNIYKELTANQKKCIAESIASIQKKTSKLPKAKRFGYAQSYEQVNQSSITVWKEFVRADLSRSKERILKAGFVDIKFVERAAIALSRFDQYFNNVQPIAFLDDITTKNVIIYNGALTGIVDTDQICFGDSMLMVGLTRQALLSDNVDSDYVEYLLDAMNASIEQRNAVTVYTLLYCLGFMGEMGQVFNKQISFDQERYEYLISLFESLEKQLRL
ncbi:MAG: phosphotransferase [Fibrobacteres bacterium]|nr:phosphotransferase [Fibrobacterota bacterium]